MIPFVDLKAQYLSIKSEIDSAVLKTLETTSFILGPEVASFEEEFAASLQCFVHLRNRFGLGVSTSAPSHRA